MISRKTVAALAAGVAITVAGYGVANAQLAPIVLLDMMFKKSNKDAQATPGHVEWCIANFPGYRPQWNNARTPDGRVTYCASPFYTPPWQKAYASR